MYSVADIRRGFKILVWTYRQRYAQLEFFGKRSNQASLKSENPGPNPRDVIFIENNPLHLIAQSPMLAEKHFFTEDSITEKVKL